MCMGMEDDRSEGKGGEQIQSLMTKLHSFRYAASLLLRMTCLDRDNYDPTEC